MKEEMTGYPSIDKPWLKHYPNFDDICIPKMNMYRLIFERNKECLDRVAINYFDNRISYREVFTNIDKAIKAFWGKGIRTGDIVTIVSVNTPETVYCIYALNYIGAVANMQLPTISCSELQENIRVTNSKILLILDVVAQTIKSVNFDIPVIILPVAKSAGTSAKVYFGIKKKKVEFGITYKNFVNKMITEVAEECEQDDIPAIIVYTSGSTGEPKGVVLSSRNINAVVILNDNNPMYYKTGERFFDALPLFISFGLGIMHLCLYIGILKAF